MADTEPAKEEIPKETTTPTSDRVLRSKDRRSDATSPYERQSGSNDRRTRSSPVKQSNRKIPTKYAAEKEKDPVRLKNRQKQIDFGKNTIGYANYCQAVPKSKRKPGDPRTPDKNQVCSKRSWDGQMRIWRKKLHEWDNSPSSRDDVDGEEQEEEIVIDLEEELSQQDALSEEDFTLE